MSSVFPMSAALSQRAVTAVCGHSTSAAGSSAGAALLPLRPNSLSRNPISSPRCRAPLREGAPVAVRLPKRIQRPHCKPATGACPVARTGLGAASGCVFASASTLPCLSPLLKASRCCRVPFGSPHCFWSIMPEHPLAQAIRPDSFGREPLLQPGHQAAHPPPESQRLPEDPSSPSPRAGRPPGSQNPLRHKLARAQCARLILPNLCPSRGPPAEKPRCFFEPTTAYDIARTSPTLPATPYPAKTRGTPSQSGGRPLRET